LKPPKNGEGEWKLCNEKTLPSFSGVGYFFGRDLQKARNVPIGLIQSAWGGTPAEAWTTAEFLEKTPDLAYYRERQVAALKNYLENGAKMKEEYQAKLKAWQDEKAEAVKKAKDEEVAVPTDDAEGKKKAAAAVAKANAMRPPFQAPADPATNPHGPSQL